MDFELKFWTWGAWVTAIWICVELQIIWFVLSYFQFRIR